ncbi:MAG TPA: carboxypeptidase-like regulatory domain-containing protein [Verrucomicrobiae bacterium]|nr:carboxypeptidase-like regulatory domain-containing protein [Verrucomicrobiae bacterium]
MSPNRLLAVLFVTLSLGIVAWAQGGPTGAISGTVQDQTGAALGNAQIDIISDATSQSVRKLTANPAGLFAASLLPVGSYTVEVSAPGFATTKFAGIIVRITETTRMTAALKPAAVQQTVEVQYEVPPVETTAATTGESLGNTTITTLPLATRNFQQLLTLSAGASSDLNGASQLGRGAVFIHVNGGREDNNNYLIEGISAADYAFGELTYTPLPNPDAIQEFKVSTSLYDASQGRNGGGNVNATLKTGTLKFHGDLWEYFRNTDLDAHDYFLGKVVVKQNIFGGDFGGPVGKDAKLGFFYVNYQGTRQRSGDSPGTYINTSIPVLPTARDQTTLINTFFCGANCRGATPPICGNGQPCLDSVALALLQISGTQFANGSTGCGTSGNQGCLIPTVPGTPGFTNGQLDYGPLVLTDPGRFRDDQFTANWDRDFNNGKDHLAERAFWSDSDTFEPFGADSFGIQTGGLPGVNNLNFPLDVPLHSRFGSITETHTFTNTLINEFRFGVNIISDRLNNQAPITNAEVGINLPTAVGVNGQAGDPNIYRLQFGTWGFGAYPTQLQSALSDNWTIIDTLSWTSGPHQLRFGGEIDHVALRRSLPIADNGLVFFTPPVTAPTDFQTFLQGSPYFGEGGGGLGNHDYRIPSYSWFVQDDYRARKDLTLNLGVRNELVGAPYDVLCHTGNTNPELAITTGQPYIWPKCVDKFGLAGVTGTENSAGLGNEYATVFEPRIGFAYDVAGRHTTSIRGGYGIYSVREDLGAADNLAITPPAYPFGVDVLPGLFGTCAATASCLANLFTANTGNPVFALPGIPALGAPPTQPYAPVASVLQSFASPCTLGNTATASAADQCGTNFSGTVNSLIELAVPLHWVVGTTQQWNITIQRALGNEWFAELGYVGTKGSRLRSTYDPDQATLATTANPLTLTGPACTNLQGAGQSCTIVDSTAENVSARAPYIGIAPSDFEDFAPNSDSHYSALQATLAHHFAKGLYFQSAYTYAKSIDDVSTASVAFVTRVNDQNNARASRGLSDFDRRHRFVASGVYQLPFFANANGLEKGALGGWETSGVIILQSGEPFTVFDPAGGSAYNLASPSSTASFVPGFGCANATSHGSTTQRLGNWLNASAYQPDPLATLSDGTSSDATLYGNTPRNCIIGPNQKNVDFTLGKLFHITEGQGINFRADFFNLFNHPSFANPSAPAVGSTPGSGLAAINSTVGTPRLIQFSLKYSF